ncbi:MAG: cation transporter [Desulfuromonas sp.]|nr:MAG: cation transporter [Desulfuromonas sp.]
MLLGLDLSPLTVYNRAMFLDLLLFVAGLLLLYYGAEYLVSGSSRLALSFGIRPLIIGMTVVAFATSMPEMMVSLLAAFRGSADIAAGNIVGSNIANIGLILGVAALLTPIAVARRTLRREFPFMLGASVLLTLLALDLQLGFLDGLLLFVLLLVFLGYCAVTARSLDADSVIDAAQIDYERKHRVRDSFFIVVGIIGLGVGAELMVNSAVSLARTFGLSELVIGISIVALGTSLPELAASIMSAWKGEMDISIGNVIGSNIFNIFFVLGICPMIKPLTIEPSLIHVQLPIMLVFSFGLVFLVYRNKGLGRPQGLLLLGGYLLFIISLFS